jgi:hypothetical protein
MVTVMFGTFSSSHAAAQTKLDLRPPHEVLRGHWKDTVGKLNYYFTKDHVTVIDGSKVKGTFPLETVEENVREVWIKVKLVAEPPSLRTIRVDFRRKGFMETLTYEGVTINNIMLYVGPEDAPQVSSPPDR